jgi:hypothetical protein
LSGVLYGGVDDTLFPSSAMHHLDATEAVPVPVLSLDGAGQAAPRFYKLEFPTFDGLNDSLNWLNHYE